MFTDSIQRNSLEIRISVTPQCTMTNAKILTLTKMVIHHPGKQTYNYSSPNNFG